MPTRPKRKAKKMIKEEQLDAPIPEKDPEENPKEEVPPKEEEEPPKGPTWYGNSADTYVFERLLRERNGIDDERGDDRSSDEEEGPEDHAIPHHPPPPAALTFPRIHPENRRSRAAYDAGTWGVSTVLVDMERTSHFSYGQTERSRTLKKWGAKLGSDYVPPQRRRGREAPPRAPRTVVVAFSKNVALEEHAIRVAAGPVDGMSGPGSSVASSFRLPPIGPSAFAESVAKSRAAVGDAAAPAACVVKAECGGEKAKLRLREMSFAELEWRVSKVFGLGWSTLSENEIEAGSGLATTEEHFPLPEDEQTTQTAGHGRGSPVSRREWTSKFEIRLADVSSFLIRDDYGLRTGLGLAKETAKNVTDASVLRIRVRVLNQAGPLRRAARSRRPLASPLVAAVHLQSESGSGRLGAPASSTQKQRGRTGRRGGGPTSGVRAGTALAADRHPSTPGAAAAMRAALQTPSSAARARLHFFPNSGLEEALRTSLPDPE